METTSALNVANFFIEVSSRENEPDLTNLKLQKILYFAQGICLARFGIPLFEEEVEAWNYGPVVKNVYHSFKHCGAFPITIFDSAESSNIPEETQKFLTEIWGEYAKYSASYLVEETHRPGTPWKKYYSEGLNNVIPQEELQSFFAN